MATKTKVILSREDSVSGTDEALTDPIPNGIRATLQTFGAAIPTNGSVDLHWGDDVGGWEFIRSIAGTTFEYSRVFRDFHGDGTKRFRVTRTKQGGGGPLQIRAWLEVLLHDV